MRNRQVLSNFGKFFLWILFICLLNGSVYGQQAIWEKANDFYINHQYDSALYYYHQLEEDFASSPELYFNLGNTYYQLHEWSQALLYFHRAGHYQPGNQEIQENIQLTNSHIARPLTEVKPIFFIRWWNQLIRVFSPFTGAMISLFIFVGILIFSYLQGTQKKSFNHFYRWLFSGMVILILSLILLISSYHMQSQNNLAIVMNPDVPLLEEKRNLSTKIIDIPEGTVVKIKKEEDNHIFVVLPNSASGWINKSSIEKVIPN